MKAGNRWGKRLTKVEAKKAVRKIEIEGLPVSHTMRSLGYSPITSNSTPNKLTKNPAYVAAKNELREAILKKDSAYFDTLATVAVEGLRAKIVRPFLGPGGTVIEAGPYTDHQTRHKFLELGARLFGFLSDKSDGGVNVFNPQQFFLMVTQSEEERGLAVVEG